MAPRGAAAAGKRSPRRTRAARAAPTGLQRSAAAAAAAWAAAGGVLDAAGAAGTCVCGGGGALGRGPPFLILTHPLLMIGTWQPGAPVVPSPGGTSDGAPKAGRGHGGSHRAKQPPGKDLLTEQRAHAAWAAALEQYRQGPCQPPRRNHQPLLVMVKIPPFPPRLGPREEAGPSTHRPTRPSFTVPLHPTFPHGSVQSAALPNLSCHAPASELPSRHAHLSTCPRTAPCSGPPRHT